MNKLTLQKITFMLFLVAISLAFGWILLPLYGAIFWGGVLAILFAPLHDRVLGNLRHKRNLAAFVMVMLFLIVILIPLSLIASSLLQEGTAFYEMVLKGKIDFGLYFQQIVSAMPNWMSRLLSYFGVTDFDSLKNALSTVTTEGSQIIATKAFSIGQITASFAASVGIMLYLLFFMLRDGDMLADKVKQAIPLDAEHKEQLVATLVSVIRATIKGNIVIAAVHGALGGVMFWFLGIQAAMLWGVAMAFMSLVPAVGTGLIWGPAAIYLLIVGEIWQGVTLLLYGVFVMGLVDNVLRPILVGKQTEMSDYIVLVSTLGGIVIFGLNGFVIGPVIAALFIAMWGLFVAKNGERAPVRE